MKNLVREMRTERGWSQGDLADKLEVSRQTINAIETGRYDPSLPLAFAIAKLFGKPIEKIFSHGEITMTSKIFAGLALALSLLAPAFSAPAKFEAGALQVEQVSGQGPGAHPHSRARVRPVGLDARPRSGSRQAMPSIY